MLREGYNGFTRKLHQEMEHRGRRALSNSMTEPGKGSRRQGCRRYQASQVRDAWHRRRHSRCFGIEALGPRDVPLND